MQLAFPGTVHSFRIGETRYRCEFRRCNNARCYTCPHGPYWVAYVPPVRKGDKRSVWYIGKTEKLPADAAAELARLEGRSK